MIDRVARRRLAQGIRHLANGRITNDEFEDQYGHAAATSTDPGVRGVFWQGAWLLYSDFTTTRYAGAHRLPRDTRRHIARWIVFLRSPLPYEWPLQSWWRNLLWLPAHLLTLGFSARLRARKWRRSGEYSVWPFRRWHDYRAALRLPSDLRGRQP
ncbi:MAG TPA: hypothetical protein VHW25_12210 [Steroidobacteraceae bacterium]|jgi:hypothetical protein|nr:hypothetical protein [Steroidobacteraceae bacterium]